jgi:hypothetical protein
MTALCALPPFAAETQRPALGRFDSFARVRSREQQPLGGEHLSERFEPVTRAIECSDEIGGVSLVAPNDCGLGADNRFIEKQVELLDFYANCHLVCPLLFASGFVVGAGRPTKGRIEPLAISGSELLRRYCCDALGAVCPRGRTQLCARLFAALLSTIKHDHYMESVEG